jgi:bifunctional non-homologous end joining protein LigD
MRRQAQLQFIPPMLASPVKKLPEGPQWQYEVKWDGYRIEAIKQGNNVRLLSRRGNDFTKDFAPVAEAVRNVKATSVILDGEVVVLDATGHPSFQALQNLSSLPTDWRLVYYAFDLLHLNGEDFTDRPLIERQTRLKALLKDCQVLCSSPLTGHLKAIVRLVRQHRLEGIVAKRKDSVYVPGKRTHAWLKMLLKQKEDFVIGGYRPLGNSLELLVVGRFEKEKLLFCGKVTQGLNPWNRPILLKLLNRSVVKKCPFVNLPTKSRNRWGEGITVKEMDDYVWVKPVNRAEIKFTEWTKSGVLRPRKVICRRVCEEPLPKPLKLVNKTRLSGVCPWSHEEPQKTATASVSQRTDLESSGGIHSHHGDWENAH